MTSLFLLAMIVAALEFVARIDHWPMLSPAEMITEPDSTLITRNRRNLALTAFGVGQEVHTNQYGFRGDPVALSKSPRAFRIMAMGDSCTFGYGVGDGQAYPAVLQRMLNERALVSGGFQFEVINAGVIGASTVEGERLLRHVVLGFHPDCVILSYALNDAAPVHARVHAPHIRYVEMVGPPAWAVWIRNIAFDHSRLCRWFIVWRERVAVDRQSEVFPQLVLPDDLGRLVSPREYVENLQRMANLVRASGAVPIFLPMPVRLKVKPVLPMRNMARTRNRQDGLAEIASLRRELSRSQERLQRQTVVFALAQGYQSLGEMRSALDNYLRAMSLAGTFQAWDFRWGGYCYANLMVEAAARNGTLLLNVVPEIALRELTDDPPGLFADIYHPGPVGHELLARHLVATVAELARRRLGATPLTPGGRRR